MSESTKLRVAINHVFLYTCKECGEQATKVPLVAVKEWKTCSITEFGGLGGWRCYKHGPCKVNRKNKSRENV